MKTISNWKEFERGDVSNSATISVDAHVLEVLKNADVMAVTGAKVFDAIKNQQTEIELKAYSEGGFMWDSREIMYYEKYGMPLNKDFVDYAINK